MSRVLEAGATTARLDAALKIAPPHLCPVLKAVRDCNVGLLFVTQGKGSFANPAKGKRPAVVLVGDDAAVSKGPNGFHRPSLLQAIDTSAAFVIVSGAPTPETYALGACVAVGGKNVMIVETRPAHTEEWAALIAKLSPGCPVYLCNAEGRA